MISDMIINCELGRTWEEPGMAHFSRYYPGICLEDLMKTMKNLGQDSQKF
jgi:hypothetical protein